ncbi:hypothetical protein K402DRAFT_457990 [Aulographum hederae CBS 113979]|uniref:Vacuolar import and degradation protein-domain-containing protein n=1 Tax=Aulographum hederae CBS 113979 TaxID=1176131 RepID=A0A6G1GKL4_9PEZI|nr:hypothetical protein K402DRAFT_457990 [Aulographum hederae CBS 113979]
MSRSRASPTSPQQPQHSPTQLQSLDPALHGSASPPLHTTESTHYLSALHSIDRIDVQDLASTLALTDDRDEEEAHEANLSFLRTTSSIDTHDGWRARLAGQPQQQNDSAQQHRSHNSSSGGMSEDRNRRDRLQRVLTRLTRLQEESYGERIPSQNHSLYGWSPIGEGADTTTQQPSPAADDSEMQQVIQELRRQRPDAHPDILRVLARAQIDSDREARRRYENPSQRHNQTAASETQPQQSESSLRTSAILQSVRRHPRFSARSRDFMQRYIMERERSGSNGEDQERLGSMLLSPGTANPPPVPRPSEAMERYELSRSAWQSRQSSSQGNSAPPADPRLRSAYRRNYLENPTNQPGGPSSWLQKTITYLSQLRTAESYEDSLSFAVDAGFVTKEFFGDNHDDFIFEPYMLPRPAKSSWLAPGAVFSGSQHASSVTPQLSNRSEDRYPWYSNYNSGSTTYGSRTHFPTSHSSDSSLNLPQPWANHHPPTNPTRTYLNQHGDPARPQLPQDRWPVKVTIHAVDYEKMTLSATMEAYNVPSHSQQSQIYTPSGAANSGSNNGRASTTTNPPFPISTTRTYTHSPPYYHWSSSTTARPFHPEVYQPTTSSSHDRSPPQPQLPLHTKSSSITTYLEGEILDFRSLHTLLTESFPSTPETDARYWRKLTPFRHCKTDDEMVRLLVSRRRMEEMAAEWVIMRWKERCFVKPSASSTNTSSDPISETRTGTASGTGAATTTWTEQDRDHATTTRRWEAADGRGVAFEDGCGLTISGFYYVCLRRSDGMVEGLYCDPQSSPYQHLMLERVGQLGGGGLETAWAFA